MNRNRLTWLIVLLALVCAGCGVRPSGAIPGDPAPSGPVFGVYLYFVRHGELIAMLRATSNRLTPIETITALASGPDAQERGDGLSSQVPPGIVPVDVSTDQFGNATLDLAVNPNTLSTLATSQLTCTAVTAVAAAGTSIHANGLFIAGQGARIGPLQCPDIG